MKQTLGQRESSVPTKCGAMVLMYILSLLGLSEHPGRSIKGPICVVTGKGIDICHKPASTI